MKSATYRHVAGMNDLTKVMQALPDDMRTKTLAEGMKALLEPILVSARRYAKRSRDTGALQSSLVKKVVNYKDTGKCVGLVGPDRNYYSKGRKIKGALTMLLAKDRRRPANYAHLVEFGHIAVTPRKGKTLRKKNATVAKGKGFVPAKPFLAPAVVTTRAKQSAEFTRGLAKGMKESIGREVKSGRHVSS